MKNINWEKIQKYYNDNHTWQNVVDKFGISLSALANAKRRGNFISRTISDASRLSNKMYPRKHSEETKKKISLIRIKYLKEHPDQVPYLLNHYSKGETYPEKYFNDVFVNNNIKCERYLQYGVYNLDFAVIDKLINIEIDGSQHIYDEAIVRSNIRKDKFLRSNNWTIIRILWSDYQKLTPDSKKEYINDLVSSINNFDIKNENIQIITLPSGLRKIKKIYYCECGSEMYRGSKRCVKCTRMRSNKPNKEDLIKLIENKTTWAKMGGMFGVSDNSVRKWAKLYEII